MKERVNYYKYLQSWEWSAIRYQKILEAGYWCERCKSSYMLQVHHKTYERLGAELMEDLEVLCWLCHKSEHGIPL